MTWKVSAAVDSFDAALKYFRKRAPMSDVEFAKLTERAHARAFKVAGLADLDLVTHVWEAIDKAIEDGSTFADFKAAIGEKVKAAWAGTVDNPPARLATIFRTNTQVSYGAGRYEQMMDPVVLKYRPYWLFDTVDDSRRSAICSGIATALGGQAVPAESDFVATHVTPLHHACRSGWRSIRKAEAEKRGVAKKMPDVKADEGFGQPPDANEWEPDTSAHPKPLREAFDEKQKSPPESTV